MSSIAVKAVAKHVRRAHLRLVEENVRASSYLEEMARQHDQMQLAEHAHELWKHNSLVQFAVEEDGVLESAIERQQHRINAELRGVFASFRSQVRTTFDAMMRPPEGWSGYFRLRGL